MGGWWIQLFAGSFACKTDVGMCEEETSSQKLHFDN
jgi:hypothetical protein